MKKSIVYTSVILFVIVLTVGAVYYFKGDVIFNKSTVQAKTDNLLDNQSKRAEFHLDKRIENTYTDIINTLIEQDREVKKRSLFLQDLSAEVIDEKMAAVEVSYDEERRKIKRYCTQELNNCVIKAEYNSDKSNFAKVHMSLDYKLDEESLALFNTVQYVSKAEKNWNPAILVSVSDYRDYMREGNWQDRRFNINMQKDSSVKLKDLEVTSGRGWTVQVQ